MMTALFVMLFSQSTLAQTSCVNEAKSFYQTYGQPSDVELNFQFKRSLKSGEELKNFWGKTLTHAAFDAISIEVTGSYHSGWFSDEMIVNPSNCDIQGIYNTYSE